MKINNLQKQQKGFTIIEVLIVLAIAGLIVLIVFLAVPALQRNSRNTQRKNDVSALVGGVQEFTNNNNGKLPTTTADYDKIKGTSTASGNAKLSFYDPAQVTINTANNTAQTPATNQIDNVIITNYVKCDNASANATTTSGATKRNVAAVFHVETSGGTQIQCQEL